MTGIGDVGKAGVPDQVDGGICFCQSESASFDHEKARQLDG
jgi:hypothetical protein